MATLKPTRYRTFGTTPSVKKLEQIKGVDHEAALTAKKILTGEVDLMAFESARTRQKEAYNPHDALTLALEALDEVLGGYGVEYIASVEDTTYEVYGLEYINFGDTYDTTLIYNHRTGRWSVGSWGDIVERHSKYYE